LSSQSQTWKGKDANVKFSLVGQRLHRGNTVQLLQIRLSQNPLPYNSSLRFADHAAISLFTSCSSIQ